MTPALRLSLSPKIFRVTRVVKCPNTGNLPVQIEKLTFAKKSGRGNIFTLAAAFNVTGKIYDPIEVRHIEILFICKGFEFCLYFKLFISAKRCTTDMTHCEDFNKLSIPGVCERANDKGMLWSDFVGMFKPKIKCPIQMVTFQFFFPQHVVLMI